MHHVFHPDGPFAVASRQRDFTLPAIEEARRRQCWVDLRDEILADWIARFPRTRPATWWCYESSEPRRRLRHDHQHHACEGLHLGLPQILFCPLSVRTDAAIADYETEAEYLARLNLLTADELTGGQS